MVRTLILLTAVVLALAVHTAGAMQVDPNTGVPLRAQFTKGVCATYTIKGEVTQRAIAYPSFLGYDPIGQSGAYWLYYRSFGELVRLRVDSLVLGPLYVPAGGEFPTSCTPP